MVVKIVVGLIAMILLAGVVAAYGTSVPATLGHTLGEITGSDTLCRSSGASCPNLKGKLSCTEVGGSAGVLESTAACASGYAATGGGCSWGLGYRGKYLTRNGNGWKCVGDRVSGSSTITAYVICCKVVKTF